jgi:hypothetical protein
MRTIKFTLAAFAVFAMLNAGLGVGTAHQHRHVGDYEFVVGFLNEPAINEEPNGLDLRVSKVQGDQATPVEGAEKTLKAEVTAGGQTMRLTISPVFNKPVSYKANFIQTAEGDYTFHVFGTIDGQPVDEKFTSSPTTFAEVQSRTALTFPNKVESVGTVATTAANASAAADRPKMYGLAGLGVGVLGLIVGIAALMSARGARSTDTGQVRATPRRAEE